MTLPWINYYCYLVIPRIQGIHSFTLLLNFADSFFLKSDFYNIFPSYWFFSDIFQCFYQPIKSNFPNWSLKVWEKNMSSNRVRADERRAEGPDDTKVWRRSYQESDGWGQRPPTEKVVTFNPLTSWRFPHRGVHVQKHASFPTFGPCAS